MIQNAAATVEPLVTPHGVLSLRAQTGDDVAFLFALHETVKGAELAPIPEPMRRQLLDMQFRGMTAGYQTAFPAARYDIVTLDDAPIGRLITDTGEGWFHIVHIAVLPEWRNRGLCTALMTAVLDQPRRQGMRCEARVAPENTPSLRLWSRLGFTERERTDIDFILEWRPPESARSGR
jgi:ribosomal protein S18 acetylase RimI-like enzyme